MLSREGFRRILKTVIFPGFFRQLFEEFGAFHGNLLDFLLGLAEHLLTLGHRGGVIDMHNGIFHALQRLKGLADNVFAGLSQYLNGHIIGDLE